MEPFDDDKPVGRVLSRREVLALLGGTGAAVMAATGFKMLGLYPLADTATPEATATEVPACVVRPQVTEGPYFVDEMLNRSDIRIDPATGVAKDGLPLRLVFRVSTLDAAACTPLAGAQVDVWHCDALGVYSGVSDRSFNTEGQQWLRGYQVTDANGTAEFMTIYPGWYPGRAIHIHFKIRTDPASDTGYEFTSQLFFDDTLSDQIMLLPPYNGKAGVRSTYNVNDGIFRNGGEQLLLTVIPEDDGYVGTFDVALDTSATQSASTNQGSGGGGPPPNGTRPAGGPPPNGTTTGASS